MRNFKALFFTLLIFSACNITEKKNAEIKTDSRSIPNEYFINAALYNYFSAEYKALAYQAFNSAASQLELLKFKNPKSTEMAIVLDIDETLLDNSPYQAKLYEINASFDSLWNEWCDLAAARPIPGSVDFLKYADSLGFNIFYVTNRSLESSYYSTVKNLAEAGFPQSDTLHLLMKDGSSSKENRRKLIERNYKVVMLVGDNIADFYEDTHDFHARENAVISARKEFGRRFIVLPNAIYGNWTGSLGMKKKSDVDSLISIMTSPFN